MRLYQKFKYLKLCQVELVESRTESICNIIFHWYELKTRTSKTYLPKAGASL